MIALDSKDSVKRLLQSELFSASNERLNGVINLPEESKKRRYVFLCVTASGNATGSTTGVKLVKVSVEEKQTSSALEMKRKEEHLLSSILNVNGRPTQSSDPSAVGFTLSIKPRSGQNFVQNTGDWISGTATNYTKLLLTLDTSAVTSGVKPHTVTVICGSKSDRDYFLTVMHKMSQRYLPENLKIQFINVEPELLHEGSNLNDSFDNNLVDSTTPGDGEQGLDAIAAANGEDVHKKELDDLQQVLLDSNMSCIDAELLISQLNQNLNLLDGENVSSIIGSEEKMLSLLSLFDSSIEEIEKLEASLEVYDKKLSTIRDYMNTMSSNEKLQKLESTNQKKLAKYLDEILNKTFFPKDQEDILITAFTSDGHDVETVENAAKKLVSCMKIIESLDFCVREKVEAVKFYYTHMSIRQNQFLDNFRKALNAKFSENKRLKDPTGSPGGGSSSSSTEKDGHGGLTLARRDRFHEELNCFTALTDILRERDPQKFDSVVEQYASKCAEQYKLDCEEFFEKVRYVMPTRSQGFALNQDKEAFFMVAPSYSSSFLGLDLGAPINNMFASRPKRSVTNLAISVSDATMAGAANLNPKSHKRGPVDLTKIGTHVIDVFRIILDQLYSIYSAEDAFLVSCFGLTVPNDSAKDNISHADDDDTSSSTGVVGAPNDTSFDGTASLNSSFSQQNNASHAKQNHKRLLLLKKMFKWFVEAIQMVIRECYMKNPVNILYLHTELINRRYLYASAHEIHDPLYADIIVDSLLAGSETYFNAYFKSMEHMINESKLVRPKKSGTMLFVTQIVEFSRATRDMFESCADSSGMFLKLHRLLSILIERLNQVQADDRSPAEVIKLENFNVLQDFLRWIRVPEFSDLTAETKKCYQENLSLYVDSYVGAPTPTLKMMFDEIEDKLEDGMKPECVKFLHSLSMQEMKRQLSLATPKEVEKGIRALYLRVSKNLSSDGPESMTSVVWGAIQREFLINHARHNELLHLCYSPKLNTLYTVEMINEFFQRDS